ncbi:MAG: biopolymer transporter ExbD [Flavobacteriales bacterium]|nr:biopolymer transporter ExbD [Flavobacteriales bacterium]
MSTPKKRPASPKLDMNPMVDLAFLLVTFFMMTTTFKTEEAVEVITPSSTSEIKIPEKNIGTITVSEDGKVFYGMDGKFTRERLIAMMGTRYDIQFEEEEVRAFSLTPSFGVEVSQLKDFLSLKPMERKEFQQPGIPMDSLDNQFQEWVIHSRLVNPRMRFAIKGDEDAQYPVIKEIIDILVKNKITRFNLITDKETLAEEEA